MTPEQKLALSLAQTIFNSEPWHWVRTLMGCDKETQEEHLLWMLDQIREKKVTGEKAHRWIGYIQGILVARGVTTVNEERKKIKEILGGVNK